VAEADAAVGGHLQLLPLDLGKKPIKPLLASLGLGFCNF
jgi:hypothetical protein